MPVTAIKLRFIFLWLLLACFSFTACFGPLSPVKYNNKVVELLDESSGTLEESAKIYNNVLPKTVTAETEIDTDALELAHRDAYAAVQNLEGALDFESEDFEQETKIKKSLQDYLDAANEYLSVYETILEFYKSGKYKSRISEVNTLDASLHEAYVNVIEEAVSITLILEEFVPE